MQTQECQRHTLLLPLVCTERLGKKVYFSKIHKEKGLRLERSSQQTWAGGLPCSACGCSAQQGHQPALEELLLRALGDLGSIPKREHGMRFPASRERHIFLLTVYESLTYSPYDTALEDRIFYLLCLAIVLVTN